MKMVLADLYGALLDQSTTLTLIAISMIGLLLISRKERSLRGWVSSLVSSEVRQGEAWAENSLEKLVANSKAEFKEWTQVQIADLRMQTVADLNQWSENSLVSLRTWLMGNLQAIGEEMVAKPISEIMKSSLMSNLGKVSGQVRQTNAIANGIAEDSMPENVKFLRDQLITRFPSLKKTLKNPAQIVQLAQSFGIDINEIMANSGKEGSNSSGPRW